MTPIVSVISETGVPHPSLSRGPKTNRAGLIGKTVRIVARIRGAAATGSDGNRMLSRLWFFRPDWSWSMSTAWWMPMSPPTPLSVKPKPMLIAG